MQVVSERALNDWIDHVVSEYHQPLPAELEALRELADAARDIDPSPELRMAMAILQELGRELLLHVRKEENVLFPWIRSGRGSTAGAPIHVMTVEHHEALVLMARISAAAQAALGSPQAAVRDWGTAYLAFDARLREHMRIEDAEIFPRALSGR